MTAPRGYASNVSRLTLVQLAWAILVASGCVPDVPKQSVLGSDAESDAGGTDAEPDASTCASSAEVCGNARDDDCNGCIDEGCPFSITESFSPPDPRWLTGGNAFIDPANATATLTRDARGQWGTLFWPQPLASKSSIDASAVFHIVSNNGPPADAVCLELVADPVPTREVHLVTRGVDVCIDTYTNAPEPTSPSLRIRHLEPTGSTRIGQQQSLPFAVTKGTPIALDVTVGSGQLTATARDVGTGSAVTQAVDVSQLIPEEAFLALRGDTGGAHQEARVESIEITATLSDSCR